MSTKILGKETKVASLPWQTISHPEEVPPSSQPIATQGSPISVSPSDAELELSRLRATLPHEVQAARQAGFQAGQAAAEQQMQSRYESVILKVVRSIDEVGQSRARFRREAEEDTVRLALAVARRILHREITMHPAALQGLVKAALECLESREVCAIRVHPSLLSDLQRAQEQVGVGQVWHWTPDATLAVGDVWVDTSRGQLDASIETQLAEIERGFADYLPAKI